MSQAHQGESTRAADDTRQPREFPDGRSIPADRDSPIQFSLSPDQIAAAFPFHIALDRDLIILRAGAALRRHCPDVRQGISLTKAFHSDPREGALSHDNILENQSRLFVLKHATGSLRLRGHFVAAAGDATFLFLGSPWTPEDAEIPASPPAIEDCGAPDQMEHMLEVFEANEVALADATKLAKRLAIQWDVSRVLSECENLSRAIPEVLQAICGNLGWQVGEVWQVVGDRLKFVEIWHSADIRVQEFIAASQGLEFSAGVGLPGRVWAAARPEWVSDVSRGQTSPRSSIAGKEGLHAAFGFPVLVQGGVWGVLDFFSRKLEEPDQSLLRTFAAVGSQIGQFIVRRVAEESLRETSTLQQAILSGTNYSIISTAPDGIIRMFNPAAERLLGYQADEFVGKLSPAIIHDPAEIAMRAAELTHELGRKVQCGFEAFVAKARLGSPDEREWTYIRKDGERIPVLLSVTALFNDRGTVTGYLGVASDITERKRAEDELVKAKEAAEAASRAKTDFLAVMSHEIRTPMNGVMGMIDLLLDTPLDPQQKEFASTVAKSGEALLEIINDVLDFSKIESGGHFQLQSEVFNPRQVLDGVIHLLGPRAQANHIELTLRVDPGVPDALRGDEGRLRQILINLVGNGIKFTSKGRVAVWIHPLSGQDGKARIRFEVEDTGIGMNPEQVAQLFRPFSQADASASRRRGGTGLGLAISKKIVELMGGRIGLASSLGKGSTFWFELAFEAAGAKVTEAQSGDKLSFDTKFQEAIAPEAAQRILLAEDHETNRRLATYMLERLGQVPDFAANGREAIASWERNRHEVILMDCQMPDMDGFEATREIRRIETAQKVPAERRVRIIALTANALAGDRERCLAAGMDSYLSKPFTILQLRNALESAGPRSETVVAPVATPQAPPPSHFHAPKPEMASTRSFDPDRPAQLCADLGDEGVEAIIEDFLRDLPVRAVEIQELANTGKWPELGRLAHSLQGIGFSFGLAGFGRQLLALEQGTQSGDQRRIDAAIGILPNEIEQGEAALRQWLVYHRANAEHNLSERQTA